MSGTTKSWLTTAAFLTALGLIIFAGSMAAYGWDFTRLSTVKYETNTYEVSGSFDSIAINVDTDKIEFVPSPDGICRVVCLEAEKVRHSAAVRNGTLVIDKTDTRKWYDYIGIFVGSPKITVVLPQAGYASLSIETNTGDITIPGDFAFAELTIHGDTADVDCSAAVSNAVDIRLSTGDIRVDGCSADKIRLITKTGRVNAGSVVSAGNIDIETDTGDVKLTDVACVDLTAESDTGTVSLKNVAAAGSFSIESDTGDVRLESCDAAQISIETDTGDVTGTLLSEKVFLAESSTGRVNVPKTMTGGKCEITTSTGDIKIEIRG